MKSSKFKEVHSSEFGFNNNLTILRYFPKKGKALIFLTSRHNNKSVFNGEKKKTSNYTLLPQDEKGFGYNRLDGEKLFLQSDDTKVANSS